MIRSLRLAFASLTLCAVFGATDRSLDAAMIAHLNLGGAADIDIQYSGGELSTPSPQNTPVEFVDFMDSIPDIPTATASFALGGVMASGPATIFPGGMFLQQLTSGSFTLHDGSTLLLSVNLGPSALTGTVGLPNDGLFTSHFDTSMVTGGTLASYLDAQSVVLQMHLFNLNGGAGLTVDITSPPSGGVLQPFTALATADIEAEQIPEPAVISWVLGTALTLLAARRRTRR